MGCNQGRSKPQRLEIKSTSRSHGEKSRVIQIAICLPEVVTLAVGEERSKLELWRVSESEELVRVRVFEPKEEQERLETLKAVCAMKVGQAREEKRVLFAAAVVSASGTVSSPSPPLSSFIHIWYLPHPFSSPSDQLELPATDPVLSLSSLQDLLVALSPSWLFVWTCRLPGGGRKSLYGNLVVTPAFQMSMGPSPLPGIVYLHAVEGSLYAEIRDRLRICGCAASRKEQSLPISRTTALYATVVMQEESEVAHKLIVVDLKANVSKEFSLSSPAITCVTMLSSSELLLGVYTEKYHCELWKVTIAGEILSKSSFHTTSKRLSLNPMDKFLSTAASTSSQGSIKRRKLSSPILAMTIDGLGTIWVLCADGFVAGFRCETLKKSAEYRVNILCEVAVFAGKDGLFIGDKGGGVSRVALPVT